MPMLISNLFSAVNKPLNTNGVLGLRVVFFITDVLLINTCLFFTCFLLTKNAAGYHQFTLLQTYVPANILWVLSTFLFGLYSQYTMYSIIDIYRLSGRSVILYLALFALLACVKTDLKTLVLWYTLLIAATFIASRASLIVFKQLFKRHADSRRANIMAIASVGGHWIELLRLMPIFNVNKVTFISNKKNLIDTVKGHKFYTVPDANRKHKFKLVVSGLCVFFYVLIVRPQVIITTGAAPGLAAIFAGRLLGVKTIWVDSIANAERLSLSGKIATIVADRVYTQWQHLATPKIVFSGNIF